MENEYDEALRHFGGVVAGILDVQFIFALTICQHLGIKREDFAKVFLELNSEQAAQGGGADFVVARQFSARTLASALTLFGEPNHPSNKRPQLTVIMGGRREQEASAPRVGSDDSDNYGDNSDDHEAPRNDPTEG